MRRWQRLGISKHSVIEFKRYTDHPHSEWLARAGVIAADDPVEQGLTGFGPVRYIYWLLVNVYRRAIGHDYFRRRVTVLDAHGGHLHYLIQVNPDFGLLVGCELHNHRGVLLLEPRQYTIHE